MIQSTNLRLGFLLVTARMGFIVEFIEKTAMSFIIMSQWTSSAGNWKRIPIIHWFRCWSIHGGIWVLLVVRWAWVTLSSSVISLSWKAQLHLFITWILVLANQKFVVHMTRREICRNLGFGRLFLPKVFLIMKNQLSWRVAWRKDNSIGHQLLI